MERLCRFNELPKILYVEDSLNVRWPSDAVLCGCCSMRSMRSMRGGFIWLYLRFRFKLRMSRLSKMSKISRPELDIIY